MQRDASAGLCGCDCGDSCELREISEGSCDFFNHGVQGEVVLNLTSCQRTASFANRTELSGIQFCAKSAKKSWRDLNFKLYQSSTIYEILLENHWGLEKKETRFLHRRIGFWSYKYGDSLLKSFQREPSRLQQFNTNVIRGACETMTTSVKRGQLT